MNMTSRWPREFSVLGWPSCANRTGADFAPEMGPRAHVMTQLETGFRKHWLRLRAAAQLPFAHAQTSSVAYDYDLKRPRKKRYLDNNPRPTVGYNGNGSKDRTRRETLESPAGVTAQIMEIARAQTDAGVSGDVRREGPAFKPYFEAIAGRVPGRTLRSGI